MSHPQKPYAKPAQTPQRLLAHLQQKGLLIADQQAALSALRHIGYFRLLIYMRPLQDANKQFQAGTTFENVLAIYNFDRELRLLCLDAIERIEVALRAAIVNELSVPLGPHFFMESRHFEETSGFSDFLDKGLKARYLAISHYYKNYNSPALPPIWAIMEAVTFGALSRFYSCLHIANRKLVAACFTYDESILVSWFRTLNSLRNSCAHHNRLWNASLIVDKPKIAKKLKSSFNATDKFYARAVILVALLNDVAPGHSWKLQLIDLLRRYPTIPEGAMGFPINWRNDPFWK
jgi:abortive infection bacteriophage resistance protein